MARVIFENNLSELALSLRSIGSVYVPTKNRPDSTFGQYSFCEIGSDTKIAIDYPVTNIPPKEFLLPPKDVLFEYEDQETKKPKKEVRVIFGVSYEDLDGLHKLKRIFNEPITDVPFAERAESTVVIGLDHFSPPKDADFDLYLQKINSELFIGIAKTKKGQEILKNPLFKNQAIATPRVTKKTDDLLSSPELGRIIEKSRNHPVWGELAEICFGCGICSYVCPLCYCFETEDSLDITKKVPSGTRCRTWDSCMLKSFAETNAGNFRPELEDRIYNWYFHKFVRMPKEYGFTGCVDCNRCVVYCPAKINYRVTLNRLVKDWEANK